MGSTLYKYLAFQDEEIQVIDDDDDDEDDIPTGIYIFLSLLLFEDMERVSRVECSSVRRLKH